MKIINIIRACTIALAMFIIACNQNSCAVKKNLTSSQSNLIKKDNLKNVDSVGWLFEKVVGKTVYFKNNKTFTTDLFDLKYIGQLKAKRKDPFLILSGRSCSRCDENISIFIFSPTDGAMKNEAEQTRYSYPGKEVDYATNKIIFESRMFYGDCTVEAKNCVMWLQKSLVRGNLFESLLSDKNRD